MTHGTGTGGEMIGEVSAAASFVCRLLRSRGHLSDVQLHVFRDGLAQALGGNALFVTFIISFIKFSDKLL